MVPRPEPIREKLQGGGASRFYPADVAELAQGAGCVLVTLTSGQRLVLKDELLNVPTGPATIARLGTFDRIRRVLPDRPTAEVAEATTETGE